MWDAKFCQRGGCVKGLIPWRVSAIGNLAFESLERVMGHAAGAPMGGFVIKSEQDLSIGKANIFFDWAELPPEGKVAVWNDLASFMHIWHKYGEAEQVEFDDKDWEELLRIAGVEVEAEDEEAVENG
jgi:hypothetical protein